MMTVDLARPLRAVVGLVCATVLGAAAAQEYPTRPVLIVSSAGTGSAADMISRALAPRLQQKWGRPVIVENRIGASGNIGVASVVRASADGHTLLIAPNTITLTPALAKDLGWDPGRDLLPIGRVTVVQIGLVVHPGVPARTVGEFVALAKQRAGALNYGSPGSGTTQHLGFELLKQITGADVTHVPYKGLAQAITDLLGGRVDAAYMAVQSVLPHIRAGKLRMIAIAGDRRSPWLPEVPTLGEQGIAGGDVDAWVGLFAPQGTPAAVVAKIGQEVASLAQSTDLVETLFQQGVRLDFAGAEELGRNVREDLERFRRIVAAAGIKAD